MKVEPNRSRGVAAVALALSLAVPALCFGQAPKPAVDVLKADIDAVIAAPDGGADRHEPVGVGLGQRSSDVGAGGRVDVADDLDPRGASRPDVLGQLGGQQERRRHRAVLDPRPGLLRGSGGAQPGARRA